jgi:hypothetical protein
VPLLSAFLTALLFWGEAGPPVEITAPDPLIVARFAWAQNDLIQNLTCETPSGCDDVALRVLALTALGQLDVARQALVSVPQRTPLWVIASHAYWNRSADQSFLREQWQAIAAVPLSEPRPSIFDDDGIVLAALEGVLAMSRVVHDSSTHTQTRALFTTKETPARRRIFSVAFGLADADSARAFLDNAARAHERWPLATGLLALGFFEYHRAEQGFSLLRYMAEREVSSSSMFTLTLLRGLVGWETDAEHHAAALEPHLPAAWDSLSVSNLMVGQQPVAVTLRREAGGYHIQLRKPRAGRPIAMQIAPDLPPGVQVRSVKVNDSDVPIHTETNQYDTHVVITTTLRNELDIEIEFDLPRDRPSIR